MNRMAGILPIKKDGSQSAISEFDESSMIDTLEFSVFVGFTEDEVKERCSKGKADFAEIKAWHETERTVQLPNKEVRIEFAELFWSRHEERKFGRRLQKNRYIH